jgi:agmatine deiminase
VLEENRRILAEHGFEVIGLPMPSPLVDREEDRQLPASYANFYIGNKALLVPSFSDRNDKGAAEVLEGLFPGREAVSIPCRELVYGYGGLHCVTQQEPKT